MDGMEEFKNKQVKIVYRDIDSFGKETRAIKVGKLASSDQDFLYLIVKDRDNTTYTAIPKSITQRIEAVGNEKK